MDHHFSDIQKNNWKLGKVHPAHIEAKKHHFRGFFLEIQMTASKSLVLPPRSDPPHPSCPASVDPRPSDAKLLEALGHPHPTFGGQVAIFCLIRVLLDTYLIFLYPTYLYLSDIIVMSEYHISCTNRRISWELPEPSQPFHRGFRCNPVVGVGNLLAWIMCTFTCDRGCTYNIFSGSDLYKT